MPVGDISPNLCRFCGEIIMNNRCVNCNETCKICKQAISKGDKTITCFDCQSVYHKSHLLQWYKEHDVCPICKDKISDEINYDEQKKYFNPIVDPFHPTMDRGKNQDQRKRAYPPPFDGEADLQYLIVISSISFIFMVIHGLYSILTQDSVLDGEILAIYEILLCLGFIHLYMILYLIFYYPVKIFELGWNIPKIAVTIFSLIIITIISSIIMDFVEYKAIETIFFWLGISSLVLLLLLKFEIIETGLS